MKKLKAIPLPDAALSIAKVQGPDVVAGFRFSIDSSFRMEWSECENGILIVVESGLLSTRTDNECVVYSSGMLIYVPPGVIFRSEVLTEKVEGYYINIPGDRSVLAPNKIHVLKPSSLILRIAGEITRWGPIMSHNKTAAQKRLVLTFLDELETLQSVRHLIVPMPTSSALCIVVARILNDPADKNGLDYWADVAGMSRRSFTDYFLKETGLSFSIWRQRAKVYEGIKLLLLGKSVTEVAAELNYPTTSAFSESFRFQVGISPKQFILREKDQMLQQESAQFKTRKKS